MASPSNPPAVGRFQFEPGYLPRHERAVERFRSDVTAALEEAGGLGLGFTLCWTTGRDASPTLEVGTQTGRRWVVGSLALAFRGGRWKEVLSPPRRGVVTRWGLIDVAGGLPALDPRQGTPWSEVAVRGLRSLPEGAAIRWTVSSVATVPPQRPRPPPVEAIHPSPGARWSHLTAPERTLRDALDFRRRAATWAMQLRLEVTGQGGEALVGRICPLLERTTHGVAGTTLRWVRPRPWEGRWPSLNLLSVAELAALFPEPWGTGAYVDRTELSGESMVLGRTEEGRVARLPVPRAEGRHLAVLGQTGMGKSTALVRLSLQAARTYAVILFDPIGDTARAVIDRLPSASVARTLWIDAARGNATFNALAPLAEIARPPAYREKAKGDLVAALRRVRMFRYADTPFWGPRLEEMVARAVEAAASYPDGTLVEAEALLRGVGRHALAGVPDHARASVEALDALARARPDEVDGARRLLAEVTSSATLRGLLCDPHPTCQTASLVRPGGLTLITGEAPTLGEGTARYFLAVLLALAWGELLARPGGAKTFLVLDEAQWYAHDAVAEMLRLGRRSNAHLWLATQSLHALSDAVREAVLTNASDFLVFRGSPDDAREFARWRPDGDVDETLALGQGEAVAWLGKGRRRTRLTLGTISPPDPLLRRRAEVVAASGVGRPPAPERSQEPSPTEGPDYPLLDLVFAARASHGAAEEFEFPFARARQRLGLDDAAIRELGSALGRAGALLHRVETPEGGAWSLAAPALDGLRAGLGPHPLAPGATAAWERLRRPDSRLGQAF